MKTLICGRGKSLIHYQELFDKKFEYIYLINEFNTFIKEDKKLLEFLKKKKSEGSKIIQQVNIELTGIDSNIMKELAIDECFCTRLKQTKESHWWRDYYDQNKYLFHQGYDKKSGLSIYVGIVIQPQPELLATYMPIIKNSLGVAILNSIIIKKSNDITIIGSDFYEADYFLSHRGPDWNIVTQPEIQNELKEGITNLVKEFPNSDFKIITYSTYENKEKNCVVENLK